jgi:hypothetical protein
MLVTSGDSASRGEKLGDHDAMPEDQWGKSVPQAVPQAEFRNVKPLILLAFWVTLKCASDAGDRAPQRPSIRHSRTPHCGVPPRPQRNGLRRYPHLTAKRLRPACG